MLVADDWDDRWFRLDFSIEGFDKNKAQIND